ncbi:hypothetical protein RIF25_06375 [Thermosynechococcaceae cyanobacterium BACA0444]|uniref:Uncharacterized protein n=1 Tax=Pseudocalidococcus azoricus BACA0444 TaxID=2918990 RepID=A0AAE4FSC4_9CYAN|nr:hypothetical protein [Pseudocalidococcus azoricus BACA0444]
MLQSSQGNVHHATARAEETPWGNLDTQDTQLGAYPSDYPHVAGDDPKSGTQMMNSPNQGDYYEFSEE